MSMIPQSCALGKKLPILLKKHQKLLLTEETQKLLIFPWLNRDFATTHPATHQSSSAFTSADKVISEL